MPLNGEDKLFLEFQQTWNLERVKNMKLDEYIQTGSTNTFAYWLEEKMSVFGSIKGHFGGLSKLKFCICDCNKELGIKKTHIYSNNKKYAWLEKYNSFNNDENVAFATIKSRIIEVIEASQNNNLNAIEAIDLEHPLKWKIAFHYQDINNIKIVDIFAQYALNYIKNDVLKKPKLTTAMIHYELLKNKTYTLQEMRDKVAIPLWEMINVTDEYDDNECNDRQFWLYKPGENGEKWEAMFRNGLMGLGWKDLGDLRNYNSKEEIENELNKKYPSYSQNRINDRMSNWNFCNSINIGDMIIACCSKTKILGFGEVVSDYIFDTQSDRDFYSLRKVKWLKRGDGEWKLPVKCLTQISEHDFDSIISKFQENTESTKQALNQILYGSPGTGKTYSTIDKALSILGFSNPQEDSQLDYEKIRSELEKLKSEEKIDISIDESNDRACAKALFDYYHNEEQIEFVTFHQNYGYEEFVEGIKPDFDEENKNVKYEIKEGIFKAICRKANDNLTKSKINQNISIKQTEQMRQNIADFCESIQKELWEKGIYDLGDNVNIKEITHSKNGNIRSFILGDSVTSNQCLTVDMLRRDYQDILEEKIKEPQNIKPRYKSNKDYHGNAGYYHKLYKKFSDFLKGQNTTLVQAETLKPYILIIDEINRGNVSKIFGELITLIEPSKRIGADEELRVTLPYSGSQSENDETKELFGVPNNLYIIGTMNTADRSITSLDTALRRRFEFVEMMPDATKLEGKVIEGINLQKMLTAINERIEFLYDREKTIGHAYLLDIKNLDDLKEAFQNKIIPLLQEYFYRNYALIQAVLNDNGMIKEIEDSKKTSIINCKGFKKLENIDFESKTIYSISDDGNLWDDPQTYINIYEG